MDTTTDPHYPFMQRCLELAAIAAAEGESPVGSVVVKDGVILGEAAEKSRQLKDISRHAEALAVLEAVKRHGSCAGATIYSNAEPCILCSYMIRHHRIVEVVFSKYTGELGGAGSRYHILTADDISSWGPPPVVTIYP
ncbi:nucleoside deaminase [Chitinophaga agrisoli]|nr:nucleoside deaminase [Chitinophaga agrisoli]